MLGSLKEQPKGLPIFNHPFSTELNMELVITILGFGNIGKFISTMLLTKREHRFHINIVDTDKDVIGAIMDLEHGAELYANHQISFNSDELFNQSDFIFHCAGASVPKGKSRLVTCQASIEITEAIFHGFQPAKEPFIIVVANPVEIITYVTQKVTGLPKQNVVGTGTFLDSIRLNHLIKKRYQEVSTVDAILLGEHGASAFLSEQLSTVNDLPFSKVFESATIAQLMVTVKAAAYEIKKTQKATIYGVGCCAVNIFEALISQQERYLPVSTYLPEGFREFTGNNNVFISLPCKVNNKGVFPNEDYQPDQEEWGYIEKSHEVITSFLPPYYS